MSSIQITLNTRKDTASMVKPGQNKENLKRVLNELNGIQAGKLPGKINLSASATDAVAASGTVTLVSAVATNTVTIGKVVFTFTSTPSVSTSTAQDVEVDGADDTADAAALAAAINTNAASSAIVYATSALGVVSVTSRVPGLIGNQIALAKSGAPITVSATYLAGGTGGAGSLGTALNELSRV
jgi:hypothetical protein